MALYYGNEILNTLCFGISVLWSFKRQKLNPGKFRARFFVSFYEVVQMIEQILLKFTPKLKLENGWEMTLDSIHTGEVGIAEAHRILKWSANLMLRVKN